VIGVFDSGIGGLSILRSLRGELPEESFVYVADSGHAPYGERDGDHVRQRSLALAQYLHERGAQALVVACNTATAAAIDLMRARYPHLPIIGVEPALKPAVALSRSKRIGGMATRGTLESEKFLRLLGSLHGQAHFVLRACDGLAAAIERSVDGQPASALALEQACREQVQALQHAAAGSFDTVVLGCTHYPLAAPVLKALLPQVTLVDTGQAVARHTRSRLQGLNLPQPQPQPQPPRMELLATGSPEALELAARRWILPQAVAQELQLP
jgi:glutamate racemase